MGFIKFDILGLSTLKMIEGAIGHILKRHHGVENPTFEQIQEYYNNHLHPDKIDLNDKQVYKNIFHKGKWAGIFQFTEAGAQNFCTKAKPNNIINISAITSIYRPGPLKANVHRKFVNAKKNAHKIQYDHPIIKEILGPTFNFVIFQEQFMLLAQKLGGFTPGESDKLRKTLVKKSLDTLGGKASERDIAKEKFVRGAKKLHGIDEKITIDLWETIEAFSVYGFNKAHAIAYAIDS